jgi:hypothetical protein
MMSSADSINELPDPPSRLSGYAARVWKDLGSSLVEQGKLTANNLGLFSDLCFWEGRLHEVKLELQKSTSKPMAQTTEKGEEPPHTSVLLSNIRAIQDEIDKRRKQLGLEIQKREDISNTPVIPEGAFEHLPKLLQSCCECIDDNRERDAFLFTVLPVISAHFQNVLIEQAEGTIPPNLFSLTVSNSKQPARSVRKAKDLASLLDQYVFKKFEKGYGGLRIPLKSDDQTFREMLLGHGGNGLIYESGLDDELTSETLETGLYSHLTDKALKGESVRLVASQQKKTVEKLSLSGALYATLDQAGRFSEVIGKDRFAGYLFYIFDKPTEWQSFRPTESARRLNRAIEKGSEKLFDLHLALRQRKEPLQIEFSEEHWQMVDDTFAEKMEIIKELGLPDLLQSVNKHHAVNSLRLAAINSVLNLFYEDSDQLKNLTHLTPSESDMIGALWITDTSIKHAIRLYQFLPESSTKRIQGERLDRFFQTLPANFSYSEAIELASRLDIPERTATRYLSSYREKKMIKRIKKGTYRKM